MRKNRVVRPPTRVGCPSQSQLVPQPSKTVYYKFPPLKARARRTKSKVLSDGKDHIKQPEFGEIPTDLLVQILPVLIETTERDKAGRWGDSLVEGGRVRAFKTGILSGLMAFLANNESGSSSDIGVSAMEVPPMQLPVSSSPIVYPG